MLETLYINKPNILLFAGKRNLARLPSGEDRVWDSVQDSVFDSSFLPLSSQGFRAFLLPFLQNRFCCKRSERNKDCPLKFKPLSNIHQFMNKLHLLFWVRFAALILL